MPSESGTAWRGQSQRREGSHNSGGKWGNALPQKGENDPGCLIMWDEDNMGAMVAAFNMAIAGTGPMKVQLQSLV